MGQLMRITVGAADYSFKLMELNEAGIIVDMDGKSFHLKKEGRSWVSDSELLPELAEAIGKAMALRYRI